MSQIPTGRYFILHYSSPDSSAIHVYVDSGGKVCSSPTLPKGVKCVFQLTTSVNPSGIAVEDYLDTGGVVTTSKIAPKEGANSGDWNLSENTDQSNVFVFNQISGVEGLVYTLSQIVPDSDYCNLFWTVVGTSQEAGVKLKIEEGGNNSTQQLTFININQLTTGKFQIYSEDGSCQLYFLGGDNGLACGDTRGTLPDGAMSLFAITSVTGDGYAYQGVLSPQKNSNIAPVLDENDIWVPTTGQGSVATFNSADVQVEVADKTAGGINEYIYEISWTPPSGGAALYLTQSDKFGGAATLSSKDSKKKQKWRFVRSTSLVEY